MGSKGAGIAAIVNPVALVANAVALGSEVYKGIEANKARKAAEDAANEQARQAQALQDQLLKQQKDAADAAAADKATKDQQASDQAAADAGNAARDASRRRQQALRSGAGSRQSTILTSPLGDVGQASTAAKTLLGA